MAFLYPAFLLALSSLAIPIIIHLFQFRRYKTVYFTNVRFLREVQEETNRRAKLKHLLVLATRLLALTALVLAFAQPYRPSAQDGNLQAQSKDVSIYLDNTFSMSALSEDVPLLEKARQRAAEIITAYAPDDRFQVLSTDFEGRDQRLLSRDEALARLGDYQATPVVRTLSQVLNRQQQVLRTGRSDAKVAYIISDFQKNSTDLSAIRPDSATQVYLVPLSSVQQRNLSIDSVWLDAPVAMVQQPNALIVRIHNHQDAPAENVRLALRAEGQEKPGGILTIPARSDAFDTLQVTLQRTGWHQLQVNITDYPITFDDDYHLALYIAPHIDVLVIHSGTPSAAIQAAYRYDTYFRATTQSVNALDYSRFGNYQLIILDHLPTLPSGLISELAQYVRNGGNVALFPAAKPDLNTYNQLTTTLQANQYAPFDNTPRTVAYINYDDFLFRDVFLQRRDNIKLPETRANYPLRRTAGSREEVILRYRDGSSFFSKFANERGHLFLCAAPLDPPVSSLTQNAEIFVPLLYKMALSGGRQRPVAYFLGSDNTLEVNTAAARRNNAVLKMRHTLTNAEFIPEQRTIGTRTLVRLPTDIRAAGFYGVFSPTADTLLDQFAFNYDRRESDPARYTPAELQAAAQGRYTVIEGTSPRDFSQFIGQNANRTPLWWWCLIIALLMLALETALLRLWR